MNCWKLPNGQYLIEGSPSPFPTTYVTSICLPGGEVLYHATPYYAVTDKGQVVAGYRTPQAYSLEDVLYIYDLHAVTNGQLCRFLWQEQWGREATMEVSDVLLTGLTECATREIPFDLATFLLERE